MESNFQILVRQDCYITSVSSGKLEIKTSNFITDGNAKPPLDVNYWQVNGANQLVCSHCHITREQRSFQDAGVQVMEASIICKDGMQRVKISFVGTVKPRVVISRGC